MSDIESSPAPSLHLDLAGRTYLLSSDTPALMRAESYTGRSIMELVEAGAIGGLPIAEVALIAAALVIVDDATDPLLGSLHNVTRAGYRPPAMMIDAIGAAIVEAGIMYAMPRLIIPLAMALRPAER